MNIDIKYPTHLQEIPLSAYQKWLKVEETTNDEEILAFKFVSIFCGLDMKTVSRMAVKDVYFLINKIKKVLSQDAKFHKIWKYNGIEFGMVPDLEKITWGEYIDIESNITKWDGLHKALAVLYRPITEKLKDTYEIEEYQGEDKYHELMLNLPLNIVLGTSVFFCNLENELLSNLTAYLKRTGKTSNKTTLANGRNFQDPGIGIIPFSELAAEISKSLTPSQNYPFIKPVPTFHILRKKNKLKGTKRKDNIANLKTKA